VSTGHKRGDVRAHVFARWAAIGGLAHFRHREVFRDEGGQVEVPWLLLAAPRGHDVRGDSFGTASAKVLLSTNTFWR
jgi:hypothetical protein